MADVVVYGSPLSTYLRTVRMTLTEKGVEYDLKPFEELAEGSPALHPFGKIPTFSHGDFYLHETLAITRYIDETFDGPRLQPKDTRECAIMNKWISTIMDYVYKTMIRGLVLPRLVYPQRGIEVDEAAIAALAPELEHQFQFISGGLQKTLYLESDVVTLADLFLLPILFYVNYTPEGQRHISKSPLVLRWLETMAKRPSEKATLPPLGG